MTVGPMELFLVFGAIVLLFGPSKLPELARSIGEATTQYKQGMKNTKKSIMSEGESQMKPLTEDDKLINTAKSMNIQTEGRPIEDIAQDILNAS